MLALSFAFVGILLCWSVIDTFTYFGIPLSIDDEISAKIAKASEAFEDSVQVSGSEMESSLTQG